MIEIIHSFLGMYVDHEDTITPNVLNLGFKEFGCDTWSQDLHSTYQSACRVFMKKRRLIDGSPALGSSCLVVLQSEKNWNLQIAANLAHLINESFC